MRGDVKALQRRRGVARTSAPSSARQVVADSIVRQYEGESALRGRPGRSSRRTRAPFLSQLSTMSAFNDLQSSRYATTPPSSRRSTSAQDATSSAARQGGRDREGWPRRTRPRSTTSWPRPRSCSASSRPTQRRRLTEASRGIHAGSRPTCRRPGRAAAAVHFAMAQVGERLRLRRRRPERLRLLRPDHGGLGRRRASGCRTPPAPSTAPGTHVSPSQLQPGDLVFYYSPISHVGMYIGNGMIVNAENPSAGVKVDRPLLDAVRRRGPPWLTPRPRALLRREGRSPTLGGWPAFRCSWLGVLGWSPGWRCDPSTYHAPLDRPTGPQASAGGRLRPAATAGVRRRRDDAGGRGPARRRRRGGRRDLAGVVRNGRALHGPRLRPALRRRGRVAWPPTAPGRPSSTRSLAVRRLRPATGPARGPGPVRRARRPPGHRRRSAGETGARPLWLSGPVQVRRTPTTLVLVPGPGRAGRPDRRARRRRGARRSAGCCRAGAAPGRGGAGLAATASRRPCTPPGAVRRHRGGHHRRGRLAARAARRCTSS